MKVMKEMKNMKEIKILTPVGMLGYGFPEEDYQRGILLEPDAVILDSGSTDPGPYMLGTGATMVKPMAYERDLRVILKGIGEKKIPLIIGSAGGDGTNDHVNYIVDVITDICKELGINKKIVKIYADVPKNIVLERFHEGKISSCSSSPEATEEDIISSVNIVAQMGAEPILKALQVYPDVDVIVVGRAYDPSPYAAFCQFKGITDPGIYWHMGKIMECGAFCCEKKGQVIMATVRENSFDLEPMDPANRCTEVTVASHTLYEKTRPDLLPGPGGILNLQNSQYKQLTDRAVRVWGSHFEPTEKYMVKLEAAAVVGYRSSFIGGVRDPILISVIDKLIPMVKQYATNLYPQLSTGEAAIDFKLYGKNAVMGELEPNPDFIPQEIGILGVITAPTQELANAICASVRVAMLHGPYPGQLATGGNLALPLNPPDNALGKVCRFSLYHLMEVNDPYELFPIEVVEV